MKAPSVDALQKMLHASNHRNYLWVALGMLPMLNNDAPGFFWSLLLHYVALEVVLHGGMRMAVNAPARHAGGAAAAAATVFSLAWQAPGFGPPVAAGYAAFAVAHLAHYYWEGRGSRQTAASCCLDGAAGPMRLALGALVAGSSAGTPHVPWLPARHYAFAFAAAALLRTMKTRFEASGQLWNPVAPGDAPLELCFAAASAQAVALLVLSVPATLAADTASAAGLLAFAVAPYFEPRFLPNLTGFSRPPGCPWLDRPSAFAAAFHAVTGVVGLARLVVLASVSWINHVVMGVEELVFFPSLRLYGGGGGDEAWASNLVLLVGHSRSGTTHQHTSLGLHPQIDVSSMAESVAPSLLLSYLASPPEWFFSRFDTKGHRCTADEPVEESFWLAAHAKSDVACYFLGACDPALLAHASAVDEPDLVFVARGLRRRAWRSARSNRAYVARPLFLTQHVSRLRVHLPGCRVIAAVRDPAASLRSYLRLLQTLFSPSAEFLAATERLESRPTFAAVAELAEQPGVCVVPFDEWRDDTESTLERMLRFAIGSPVDLSNVSQFIAPPTEARGT
ncbi:hypothetical protein DIPPA_01329 [Diplonema papillatum]|nr:hypothetical protein DIPPA_01329 [Diplonema papillatum]